MRDVLDNLTKLPPKCAVIMDGISQFIHRGAPNAVPAFLNPTMVDQWNRDHGVSPQQVQAMIVGVTLGWDKEGADPDTHAENLGEKQGPFTYDFVGTIEVSMSVVSPTLIQARHLASATVRELVDTISEEADDWPYLDSVTTGDSIDLLETDDPYA